MSNKIDGMEANWEAAIFSKVCTFCINLTDIAERKCKAFPNGIPRPIWLGLNDHKTPYKGDHGIKFERERAMAEPIRPELIVGPEMPEDAPEGSIWIDGPVRIPLGRIR